MMEKEKLNIILTTKGGAEFAVTVPADACTKDELIDAANAWKAKLNAKHAGTDYEVTDFRYASDTEVANFTPLPDELTKNEGPEELSPIMKQWTDLKKKHPEALLLFRCGDFYETYCEDAEKAAKILGITLTKSNKTKEPDGRSLRMAGFPYHTLDTYLPKIIRAGERVAICDQIEAPKRK